MAPLALVASPHPVGDGRGRRRLLLRPLARQRHRQRLPTDSGRVRVERRGDSAGTGLRGGRVDGRHRRAHLSAGEDRGARAHAAAARADLGALLPDDRRPQGGGLPVRRRRAPVPLHRWAARHAHPHRAAEPDQPRVRAGGLHRHRERARHDHDDDGLLRGGGAARQLARPAHDRLAAHGLPTGRVLLLLDLQRWLSGDRRPRCSSAGSRRGGRATPRCRPRRGAAWIPISSASA